MMIEFKYFKCGLYNSMLKHITNFKIQNKIKFIDFIPPIVLRVQRKFLSLINQKNIQLEPFVHPIINSYSQFQEDLMIDVLLNNLQTGFYVDVGANDPTFLSNTQRFYSRG